MKRFIACCIGVAGLGATALAQTSDFPPFPCLSLEEPYKIVFVRADGSRYATTGGSTGWYPESEGSAPGTRGKFHDREEAPLQIIYTRSNGAVFGTLNGEQWFRIGTSVAVEAMADNTKTFNSGERSSNAARALSDISFGNSPGIITFSYQLDKFAYVRVSLVSGSGEEIRLISDGYRGAGRYSTECSVAAMTSGTYFLCFDVDKERTLYPVPINK